MNRFLLKATALLATTILILGCKGGTSTTAISLAHLDGSIEKWQHKTPAWDNGPVPADKLPEDVHIMRVFFENDNQYFYVFIQCSPTIQERYKITKFSGDLGDFYIDPENDPETGSPPIREGGSPKDRGYKFKLYPAIGVFSSSDGTSGPFVGYDIYRFSGKNLSDNQGFNMRIPDAAQESTRRGALIAQGKDGVEMAVPLAKLGLKPGTTARVLIENSYVTTSYDLKHENGFVTYTCR